MDPINKLTQIKHKKLKLVRDQLFKSIYAFEIDVFKPQKNVDGETVLEDEDDFEEADVVGTLNSEDLPIQYGFLDASKAIEIMLEENGALSYARAGEINEFDPDKIFKYLIQDPDIPLQTVIQFEVPISTEDETGQVMTLIKVDEQPVKGKTPFVDVIHLFASFHGDLS